MKAKYKVGESVYTYHDQEGVVCFVIKDIFEFDGSFVYYSGPIESKVYNAYIEIIAEEKDVAYTEEGAMCRGKPRTIIDVIRGMR